jgi:FHA domain
MVASLLLILRLALMLSLYGFLAWAFLTLWRDLKMQSKLLALRQPPPVWLWLESEAESVPLQFAGQTIAIGRDPMCDMILEDGTVSAQHARLTYRQGQWWLEDLHSTNGTFLNQDAVLEPVVITSGDELRCGQVVLHLKIGEAQPA